MVLTELPMVIVVKLMQVEKASSPMEVTESGIVIDVNPVLKKAPSPMEL